MILGALSTLSCTAQLTPHTLSGSWEEVTAVRADQGTGRGGSVLLPSVMFHQAMSFFPLNLLELQLWAVFFNLVNSMFKKKKVVLKLLGCIVTPGTQ